jgi:hypothetical protein
MRTVVKRLLVWLLVCTALGVGRAEAQRTSGARTLTIGLDAFNGLNRVNLGSYVGNVSSPFFGQPVAARAPRELQVSAHVKF